MADANPATKATPATTKKSTATGDTGITNAKRVELPGGTVVVNH